MNFVMGSHFSTSSISGPTSIEIIGSPESTTAWAILFRSLCRCSPLSIKCLILLLTTSEMNTTDKASESQS